MSNLPEGTIIVSPEELKEAMGRYYDAIKKEPEVFNKKAVLEYSREQYADMTTKEIINHITTVQADKAEVHE